MTKKTLIYIGLVIFVVFGFGFILRSQFGSQGPEDKFDVDQYCEDESVAGVYYCQNGYLKVVSKLLGGGSRYIKPGGTKISCPVVAPDQVRQECKELEDLSCEPVDCEK